MKHIYNVYNTCRTCRAYLGITLLFLFSTSVAAQRRDANINGHVVDARTEEHLPYVVVALKGTTIAIATDATGHYFMKDLPEGDFVMTASCNGYKSASKPVSIRAKTTLEVNFELEEETVSLDEVVVSATRNETRKNEAGIIVNILSAKHFEAVSGNNPSETMNFRPGLRVENNCGNCGMTQLRINGLEGQYSQILIDSRPVFGSLASVYGLEQLPSAMIERIEVIRGGGSALFGSTAVGGVVNVITKEPMRNSALASHQLNVFADGTTDANTALNVSLVTDDHRAGIHVFGMVKDRKPYDRNGDGFSDLPELGSETLGFKAYYRTGTYSKLTAEYHRLHERRRGGNRFDRPPHEADIAEYLDHVVNGGGLKFDLFSPGNLHRVSVYASAQGIGRDSYFAAKRNTDNYGRTTDFTAVAGAQYTRSFDRLWFLPAELTGGVEYTHNGLKDSYAAMNRNLNQTTSIAGAFLQNEWKNARFGVLIGARLDKHNLMDRPVFSPRGTLRFKPARQVNLRASWSSGYRAPQAYNEDLHIEAVGGNVSVIELAPGLRPEYSHSLSVSGDVYHSFGRLQTMFLVEGFHTMLNDVFALEKTGANDMGYINYVRRNAKGAKVTGVNLEAELGIPGVFELQAGYTLQQSRYNQPERWSETLAPQRDMFRSPSNYGYFTSSFDVTKRFRVSLFGSHTGSMLVKHTLADGTDSERKTPSFFDAGLKLARRFTIGKSCEIEMNAGVKNIFDSFQRDLDYGQEKDSSYIYGPSFPRLFFAGIKVSL